MHSKNYLPHHYLDTQSQNKALVSSRAGTSTDKMTMAEHKEISGRFSPLC